MSTSVNTSKRERALHRDVPVPRRTGCPGAAIAQGCAGAAEDRMSGSGHCTSIYRHAKVHIEKPVGLVFYPHAARLNKPEEPVP